MEVIVDGATTIYKYIFEVHLVFQCPLQNLCVCGEDGECFHAEGPVDKTALKTYCDQGGEFFATDIWLKVLVQQCCAGTKKVQFVQPYISSYLLMKTWLNLQLDIVTYIIQPTQ